jgi:peptide deformylase
VRIPKIREYFERLPEIEIEYVDENFKPHRERYNGLIARVIQHEYDHTDGKLFTDRLSPFKRKMLAGKLNDISAGKVSAEYKTKLYKAKK